MAFVSGSFSVAPAEILDSEIIHNILANLTFSLSATQKNMAKECCWLSQINVIHEYFSKSD